MPDIRHITRTADVPDNFSMKRVWRVIKTRLDADNLQVQGIPTITCVPLNPSTWGAQDASLTEVETAPEYRLTFNADVLKVDPAPVIPPIV